MFCKFWTPQCGRRSISHTSGNDVLSLSTVTDLSVLTWHLQVQHGRALPYVSCIRRLFGNLLADLILPAVNSLSKSQSSLSVVFWDAFRSMGSDGRVHLACPTPNANHPLTMSGQARLANCSPVAITRSIQPHRCSVAVADGV